jgi:hypothetical protein
MRWTVLAVVALLSIMVEDQVTPPRQFELASVRASLVIDHLEKMPAEN